MQLWGKQGRFLLAENLPGAANSWNKKLVFVCLNSLAHGWCCSNSIKCNIRAHVTDEFHEHLWNYSQVNTTEYLWWEVNNGAVKQQAITWSNVDPDLCRRMASQGQKALNDAFNSHIKLISLVNNITRKKIFEAKKLSKNTVVNFLRGMLYLLSWAGE